jgi:uncharacterized integral membrane protein (TIGR00698 family)
MKKILHNEDWLSFATGLAIVLLAIAGLHFAPPKFGWATTGELGSILSDPAFLTRIGLTGLIVLITGVITVILRPKNSRNLIAGLLLVFVLGVLAQFIAGFKPVKYYGFEYVIFALIFGILVRAVIGLPKWLEQILHTEFFVKTGLVILGSGIIFGDIIKAGSMGLIQAVVVVLAVWFFAFWISGKLGVDDELRIMLSSAVSICGVSAAIAAAGAIKGDGKKLSYVVSMVLIIALPMLILLPLLAKWIGLNPAQAGAWMGGTIDTTGAVVASGSILGEDALKYSTIIKFSQNVLIGFAAVGISLFWALRQKTGTAASEINFRQIWDRFPKFVLGFILASVIFSFFVGSETVAVTKDYLKNIQTAFFAVAFVSIGLETDFKALINTGNGRPAWAFVLAQLFNIVFTLIIAWILFANYAGK